MARRTWFSLFRTLFGGISSNQTKQAQRPNLLLEQMEDRTTPAAFVYNGTDTLTIDLDNANEAITLTAQGGGNYFFTSNNIFIGTDTTGLTRNTGTLTITNALALTSITITDSATGTSVNFGTSLDSYVDNMSIVLDDAAAGNISFTNNTTFDDATNNALSAKTTGAVSQTVGSLVVAGTSTFAAGAGNDITLFNDNNFSSVGITSGRNVTLKDTTSIALNASTVSGTLSVTANGAITDNGALSVTGAATFAAGAGNDITLDAANDFSSVGITSGNNVALNDTSALALNASTISGTLSVTANGAITDNGALSVTGAATFAAGAGEDITLDTATNAFSTVTITSGANVTLSETGGFTIGGISGIGAGNIGIKSSGAVAASGAITTTGIITLNGLATSSAIGIAGGAGDVQYATSVFTNLSDGASQIVVGSLTQTGMVTVGGAVSFSDPAVICSPGAGGSVTVGGAITGTGNASVTLSASPTTIFLNADITTAGQPIVLDNGSGGATSVVLGANVALSSGAGAINVNGTVDGAFSLTLNSTDTTTFSAAVGGTTALTSLTTDAGGTTAINGGAVTTTGNQSFGDAVTLGAATTLVSKGTEFIFDSEFGQTTVILPGDITLGGTVNGAQSLTVNTFGTTTLRGAVGGTTELTSLTIAAIPIIIEGGVVRTTGHQSFSGAVVLGANTILASTGSGAITLRRVDGAHRLIVSTTGTTTFSDAVGDGTALTSLDTDAGGTTAINGGVVRTTGDQSFGDAVTLGAATTLVRVSTDFGVISFSGTVNGAQTLAVINSSVTAFNGAIGGTTALTSITTDAPGTLQINTSNITTTGNQTYNENFVLLGALGGNTALKATGSGNITFAGSTKSMSGTLNLTLSTASTGAGEGGISFTGAITSLGTLTITNSNGATFQSSVSAATVAITDTTDGGTVAFQGDLTASSALTVAANGAYNVSITGSNNSINGSTTFNNTGTVTLGNDGTDVTFFNGSLSTAATSTTNTGGAIRTPGASITINRLNALANTTLDATNNGANPGGADVTITNGSNLGGFKVDTVGGTSGSTNVTGNTTINAGQMIVTSGNLNLGTSGDTLTTSGNTLIKVMTGSINLTSGATLATGTDTITLQADTININAGSTITGTTSTVILTPTTATRDIYVGGAASGQLNSLQLPQASITPITAGTLVIGTAGNTGVMTIGTTNLDDKTRFVANGGGGKFMVTGTITSTVATGAGIVGVQFVGSGSTTVLSADIVTSGTAIEILDAVQVDAGTVTLDTTNGGTVSTGANVLITGGTSGIFATSGSTNNSLIVNAGSGGTALLGSLRGFGTGGGTGELVNNLTVTNAATTSLPSVNLLAGTVNITSTNITLGADLTAGSTNGNGSLTLTGAVALTSSVVLAGDGITVTGGITGNNNNLTLDANGGASGPNGTVTVSGAMSNIQGLNVQDAAGATFAAVTAQTVQLSNTNTGTVNFAGNLAVAGQFAAATGSSYNLAIVGSTNTIGGPVSFINTGSLTLGNGDADSTIIGSGVSRSAQTLLQGTVNFGGAVTLGSAEATTASGNLTLTADSLSLTHNGGNTFGAVSITTTNATVFAGGTLASTTLGVSAGSISQTGNGVLAPTGAATLTATGDISLGGSNTFGGDVTFSGANVTLNDNSALSLTGANKATGNLALTSTGGISQTGGSTVAVTGSSTLSSTGQDITLSQAGNTFTGPVGFTGANVTLRTSGALALAASTATGTFGATSNGLISQTGPLNVTGATTLAAGVANNINLNNAANSFTSVGITSGNNVAITDTGALALDASTVSGTLDVVTTGAITQSGATTLNVSGAATFAAGAANDITLTNANDFTSVGITSGNNVAINDTNALALNASTISGTLDVTTAGAITDNGVLNVTGAATFAAGAANDINLDNTNNFSSVGITTGNDVFINDTGDLTLNASTISGLLSAVTTGNIGQSAALSVTGATSLTGNNITLTNATNSFTGDVTFNAASNVNINDNSGGLGLGSGSFAIGNATISSAGAITDAGPVSVGGNASFAGASATLNDLIVSGTVGVNVTGAATLVNATALTLAASTIGTDLDATATTGALTDAGTVTVGGNAMFTTASKGDDITLDQTTVTGTTKFTTTGVKANASFTTTGAVSLNGSTVGGDLAINTTGTIGQTAAVTVVGNTSLTGTAITLNNPANSLVGRVDFNGTTVDINDSANLILAASTSTGSLTLNSGGAITQTGALSVGTSASITATGGIKLDNADNNFGSTVGFSGANVALRDSTALALDTSTATGTLDLTSGGAITQSGATTLTVTGAATLDAGPGNDITLTNNNNFSSVGITSGNNVSLNDTNDLALNASTVSGTLSVTANGAITDNGALSVTGAATFAAGTGNNITLDAANDFSSVGITSGNNVVLNDTNALALNASTVSGTLGVTTNGAITDNGALSVTGAATFAAGAVNNITLDAANDFSSVGITSGNNVALNDTTSIALNASTVSGTLGVTAVAGAISDNGALVVTGAATFAATTGITLDAANNFSSVNASTTGGNVVLNDTGDLVVAGVSANTSLASISAAGAVTQTGAITGGSLELTGAGSFALTNAGNNVADFAANATGAVSYTDSTALSVGATVGATKGITSSGAVTVATLAGALTLTSTGDIVAGGDVNLTGSAGISTAGDVTTSADAVNFNSATTLTGNVAINTNGGNLAFAGALAGTTAGAQTLGITAGAGDVSFGGEVGSTALGAITINSADDVTAADAITAASLTQTTGTGTTTLNGAVSTTGAVSVANEAIGLNAGITTTAGAVTLNATVGALTIAQAGDIIADGTVSLTGQGGIVTGGDVVTTGDTVSYNNDVTLAGNVLADTTSGGNANGATISFAGSVNADNAAANNRTLTLNSGNNGGTIGAGNIGNLQPLAGLTITNANSVTFSSDVFVNDGAGVVTITDTTASVTFQGSLVAGKLITGFNGFDLSLLGSNNALSGGATTLSNTGFVQIGDNATDVSLFTGGLTVTSATPNTKLAGFIRTASSPISLQRSRLVADTTLDTTNNGASVSGAAITLDNGVSLNGFTLQTISGTTGGTTITGTTDINNGTLTVASGNLTIGNGTTATTVNVTADTVIDVQTGALNVLANSAIVAGANNLTLLANTMNIQSGTDSISTTGTLTVAPSTPSRPIFLGGAATGQANSLQLNQASMDAFSAGLLVIGAAGDTGTLTMGALTINDALQLIANGGGAKVIVSGAFQSTYAGALAGLEVVGSGATTVLGANITTSGTAVVIDDSVQVNASTITITTAGDDVTITGGSNGIFATKGATNNLVVAAGIGNVVLGSLQGFGTGGTGSLVTNLTVDGATISLPTASAVNGIVSLGTNSPVSSISVGQNFSSGNSGGIIMVATDISLGGNLTAGATLTVDGAVALGNTVTLAGDGINITGSIDAAGNSFTLDGRSGTAGTPGAVTVTGAITNADGLTLVDAAGATFGSAGAGPVSAQTLQISSTNTGTVQFSNTLTVAGQLSAASGTYALSIIGTGNLIGGPVSFLNTGILTIGDQDADTTLIQSGVSRSQNTRLQGSVTFGGATTLAFVNATTAAGELNLTADSLNLGFFNGGNGFGGVSITTAGATTFTAGALPSTILTINAGSIGQTGGTLAPTGTATLTATGTISLGGANNFGDTVTFSGANVTINDTTQLTLDGTSSATGNLVLSSNNGISQTGGTIAVVGSSTLTSAGKDISLNQAGNTFTGPVGFTGANVSLGATGALALAASTATGTLDVTTTGALSQTGVLNITGTTTLSATDIALGLANTFNGDVGFTGANVTINDTGALNTSANSSASGSLALSATGDITDGGNLSATGNASFTTPQNVNLDNLLVGGAISVNTGGNAALVDNFGSMELGASTVGGNLNVNAAKGVLSDNGTISVTGNAFFQTSTAGSGIVLDQISVTGTINLDTATGGNASVTSARPITFNGSSVRGDLAVTTPGNISQTTAAFTVTGDTSLSGAVINLGFSSNDFQGTVGFTGTNVTLTDSTGGLALSASSATGNVFVQALGVTQTGAVSIIGTTALNVNAGNLVLGDANNSFTGPVTLSVNSNATLAAKTTLVFDTSSVAGNLTVDSIGVDQVLNKHLIVNGDADIDVTVNGDISLDNAQNNFGTLFSFNGRNVAVTDLNSINFGNGTAAGTLGVVANGTVTQAAGTALNITGNATFTNSTGATGDITLANAGNAFAGTIGFTGNDVDINDSTPMVLAQSLASGNLNLTNATSITQTGKLTVTGDTTASVTSGDISLDNAGNAFTGSVGLTVGGNAVITDSTPLLFGATTVSGTLLATSGGAVTQNAAVSVTGNTTLVANGFDINLPLANNFSSIGFGGADNVSITDSTGISLNTGSITGALVVNATGDITDNGPLTVADDASFNARFTGTGTPGNVILDAANDFNAVGIVLAQNVVLNDTNALTLNTSQILGTLDVTTNGQISGAGVLVVTGVSTFAAGQANDILLANALNDFGTVKISTGKDVVITDSTGIDLGASTVSGTLDINATGAITDSGALVVTGTATFDAGPNDITLDNANNFSSVGIDNGKDVVLNDTNALVLNASTVTGTLDVTTSGAITNSGALVIGGAATFEAGAANNITLGNAGNNFNSVGITSGKDVSVTDINDIVMAASAISGDLSVTTTGGGITGTQALSVDGAASFLMNGAFDLSLTGANDFSSVAVNGGRNATFNDVNDLVLAASSISGNLDITAENTVTDSGLVSVGGTASFDSNTSGAITLDLLSVTGLITVNTQAGDATIVNAVATSFGGSVGGLFSVRATTGGITDGGPIIAMNGLVLQAPGTSTLTQALAGTGGLTFNGTGTLTVAGTNTYTGDTVLTAGTLSLTGSLASSHVRVQGGTLRGNGALGNLTSTGGTVRPGNSPGSFTSGGAATIGAGSTYTVEINGLTAVTGYSQLVTPGAVLGGTLTLTTTNPGFNPQIGTRFTIIDNTGPNKLSGTFAGLPEGGVVFNGNQGYTITYKGGTGNNDVQLIRTNVIPTPTGPVVTTPFSLNPGVLVSATNGTPAQVQLSTVSGGFNGGVTRRIVPFRGYTGMISVNALDRTGDGVADSLLVSKATPGNLSTVMVIDAATGRVAMQFNAFGNGFMGGARVSSGLTTINGVTRTVITVAAGPGSTPAVKVYDSITGSLVKSFNAFGTNYRSGLDLAMTSQTATQPGVLTVVSLVNSFVRVFDLNSTAAPLVSFRAYTQQPMPATSIAVGDVNGDGSNEIIVGVGNLNLPAVRVFNMAGQRLAQFTPYPLEYTGGVTVGVNDYDRDGVLDIVTVAQSQARGRVRIFRATGSPVLGNFRLASVLTLAATGSNRVIEVQQPN